LSRSRSSRIQPFVERANIEERLRRAGEAGFAAISKDGDATGEIGAPSASSVRLSGDRDALYARRQILEGRRR